MDKSDDCGVTGKGTANSGLKDVAEIQVKSGRLSAETKIRPDHECVKILSQPKQGRDDPFSVFQLRHNRLSGIKTEDQSPPPVKPESRFGIGNEIRSDSC
jgi:hypothetical protein